MKKTAFLTALLIGTSLSTSAMAEVIDDGTCGDDCYWEFDDDTEELHIYGSGEISDYGVTWYYPWWSHIHEISSIKIDEGITAINADAFGSTDHLTQITLPNTLLSMGDHLFIHSSIESILIPESVTYVGPDMLWDHGSTDIYVYCPSTLDCSTQDASVLFRSYEKDENGFYYNVDDDEYYLSAQDMINGDTCGDLHECQATALEDKGLCEWDDCYDFLDSYEEGDKIKMGGKTYASLSDLFAGNAFTPEKKRIYTIEEATRLSKPTGNTFKIRYK